MNISELRKIRKEIIKQYYNGCSFEDLKELYSTTWTNIYNVVCTSFENDYSNITKEQKILIYDMYRSGMSITQIGEKLKIHHKTISKVLDENGIKRINNNKRIYKINEHYFDKIDTQNKAYILGFLYADGCNLMDKHTVAMTLEEKDKEILEKIRSEINSEKKLEFINQSKRTSENNYHYKDMWRLLMFSTHMCNQLNRLGMTPNKSLSLEFPEWLDKKLYPHFIRGYFDGDGSLCCRYTADNKFQPLFTITSTNNFCQKCLEILREETSIGGGIYDASSKNGITKVLSISGVHQIKRVMDWLYKDAELYMERKHDVYLNDFCIYFINNSQVA